MFFLQLRQLLWKNFTIRKRSKFRVATELIWPCILFLILAWVRTKGLKEYRDECFLQEKALPSAGLLPFLQSLFCTYSNNCFNSSQIPKLPRSLDYEQLRDVVPDIEKILRNRITNKEEEIGKNVTKDIMSGFMFFIHLYSGGLGPSQISIPLASIFNQESLNNISISKNITPVFLPSLTFSPKLQLPTMADLKMFQKNPQLLFCNESLLKTWIDGPDDLSKENLIHTLCQSSADDVFGLFNKSTLFHEALRIVEENLGQPLHTDDWLELNSLFGTILSDIRYLDSLNQILRKAANTTLAKITLQIFNEVNQTSATPMQLMNMASKLVCGVDNMFNNSKFDESELRKLRRKFLTKKTTSLNRTEVGASETCNHFFFKLQDSPETRLVWELFYPFIRGKLLYSPNTRAFSRLIEQVNSTFHELKTIQDLSAKWLNQISPTVRKQLAQLDIDNIKKSIQKINPSFSVMNSSLNLLVANTTEQKDRIEQILDQLDYIADMANTYIDCYEFNKFEAFSTEEEATVRGMQLMETNQLWAIVAFQPDEADNHSTLSDDFLPPHVTYKIRMDSYKIDTTKRIRDVFRTPIPRIDPRIDMRYFTSGFIYLQDIIERAIVAHHTQREKLPGMYMQQFPSPCYVFDTFFIAISQLFPLFMILSFVYTCAMIVKSVVHEKERRLKETMRTMGLGNGVHWLAWFIDSMVFTVISCFGLSIILVFGKVLEKSDPTLVFIFILCFSVATVCKSFLISTLFSRANLAAACGGFIFFACFLPYNVLDLGGRIHSLPVNIVSSLLSNVAFAVGCSYFANFEQNGEGAQWSNIAVSPLDGDSYSLLGCIGMLLADSLLYLILTWYIETVFPGQYGVPKKWYFMFQSSYWCPQRVGGNANTSNGKQDVESIDSVLMEEEPKNLRAGVRIHNLGKTYSNGKEAVRNLNLGFYEDQITSFLGHNGAGKTTTISILTGLFPPTSGTAVINGLDIRDKMDAIRQQLGLCPQHNVLFDQLTVEEHLLFYASLKTGTTLKSRQEVDKMIEDLGLSHKRHDYALHLSGGMKRKLSIGAAFIGNSKTVILDEPTAGVDPYSRRSIWDILLKYKTGRTIILTTHFMDEADILGDRIAIISQGQLKCCGSSLFLKQKLGSGYYLTLVKKTDSFEETAIQEVLKRNIPNGYTVQNVGSDLVLCLPEFDEHGASQRHKFVLLFEELDSKMAELGLDSYGVSDTTLEEIFLKMANDPADVCETKFRNPIASNQIHPDSVPSSNGSPECFYQEVLQTDESPELMVDDIVLDSTVKVTSFRLIIQQLAALYIKRFHNSRRNLKGLFCEVVLPAIFIIANLASTKMMKPFDPEPPLPLSPWLYGDSNVAFFANHDPNAIWSNRYVSHLVNGTGMGIKCLRDNPQRLNCSKHQVNLGKAIEDPDGYKGTHCPCIDGISACSDNSTSEYLFKYHSITSDEFYNLTGKSVSQWILHSNKKMGSSRFGGFEFGVNNPFSTVNFTELSLDAARITTASRLEGNLNLKTADRIMTWAEHNKAVGMFDNVRIWFNNKGWASSVSYLNAVNNLILRSSLPERPDRDQFGITAINHPMNYTQNQLEDKIVRKMGFSVLHAIAVIFSMSFVPASFVIFLVEERVSKAKHLQFVSGVKPFTFWISTYTWDLLNYVIPSFLCVLIFIAFDQEAYVGPRNIIGMILLLLFYGLASIPLMYPASLVFDVPSSAFVGLACANLFVGIITTISSFVLQLFDDEQLKFIGSILNQVYFIFPHYCLGRGLMDMAQQHFVAKKFDTFGIDYNRSIFEWSYLGRNLLFMTIQAVLFFSFNLMLHYRKLPNCLQSYNRTRKLSVPTVDLEDEDVARERTRVEEDHDSNDELRLVKLTKVYDRSQKVAVNRLSFGLRKGECFGLLGVNGAGKSTTFKMLTGDESVTDGEAYVGGHSVLSELDQAQQNLGYCPQEDALLSLLTGTEHLQLFARLRGVPAPLIEKVVSDSIKKLSLGPYKDRCAGTYSGGNKRKLSTAVAFIGKPSVVFLDEPSSGMDPKARRSLWDAILDAVRDSRSVLLTSHSMEECQVLCSRLAIMVNGTLRCIGSAQHLKNRFGNGYMINVRCEGDGAEAVMQYIHSTIPEAQFREQSYRQLVWHIQPDVLPISVLFQRMEAARVSTAMEDYSISQTTLDDVFIRFANLQRDSHNEMNTNHQDLEFIDLTTPLRRRSHSLLNYEAIDPAVHHEPTTSL